MEINIVFQYVIAATLGSIMAGVIATMIKGNKMRKEHVERYEAAELTALSLEGRTGAQYMIEFLEEELRSTRVCYVTLRQEIALDIGIWKMIKNRLELDKKLTIMEIMEQSNAA